MKLQKSSRKISVLVVIFVLLIGMSIGGYLVLQSRFSKANQFEELMLGLSGKEIINDHDYDGLADWEEELYGTDPNNPDTDGDGYLDGEEVASGYDPTKRAPNDKFPDQDGGEDNSGRNRPDPGNLTQTLNYILSNQLKSGQMPLIANIQDVNSLNQNFEEVFDQNVLEALRKSSVGFLAEFIPPFQKNNRSFEIASGNNLTAIREYAGQVSEKTGQLDSCRDALPGGYLGYIESIEAAIENNNYIQTDCMANTYLRAYQERLKVPVPLDWLDIHKKSLLVNWTLHKFYQHLPEYNQDPLKGIILMEKFEEANKNFTELIQEMKADLDSRQ
jgi:hypothetical protein